MDGEKAANIWELGLQIASKKKDEPLAQRTLQFIGSRQSGKTSLVYRFVDKSDNPKPTLALEYVFARKKRTNEVGKDVCDIWELGGENLFTNLLQFSITKENISTVSVVLVLNLAVPEEIVLTAESLIDSVKERINDVIGMSKLAKELKQKAAQRFGQKHRDLDRVDPFPIPLLIVGSKYDLFEELDLEKRKVISSYLRLLAHLNGASLLYVTTKSEALVNKMKTMFSHLAFDSSSPTATVTDHNKPLFVPFGADSFESIGQEVIEFAKNELLSLCPQKTTKVVIPDDPAADPNFRERDIDLIYSQKRRELDEYKRQLELKSSMQ
ncbi:cytoplasmic dynein 2 light intermediate chain 1-like protein [Dinothrombium tinctorium]|uniref:Cytoplasmic dynein 2 light intermediate chain 1 n=1 Tax=Dinothrombium tinctorium TaxID=1965070 RepID=A0A3S3Q737_9ACAR|nr:cytoplasmic dynein 2 light intermediate chain 1-like protein [Dinothrombium tinctorium]RWS15181.1 cytoplasmic dynein 2 light intermediate chain 1-like protein [Dinothrombium tinctorium]